MNIVMITTEDSANAGNEVASAINKYTDHNIRVATTSVHSFRYKNRDLELRNKPAWQLAETLIKNADILHFKGDHPPLKMISKLNNKALKSFGRRIINDRILNHKIVIVSTEGNFFRRKTNDPDPLMRRAHHPDYSYQTYPMHEYISQTDVRTTFTADLNYKEYQGRYTQHAMNTEIEPRLWQNRDVPIIGHSPSIRKSKGTDDLFLPAMEILKNKGYKFEINMIEGLSHPEALKRKKNCTIFFDQCSVGAYGVSLIEAAQWGIPVMAWISPMALRQAEQKLDNCAVINFDPSVESIVFQFEELLKSDLNKKSIETKEWVDNFHGYKTVANLWDEIYINSKNSGNKRIYRRIR